MADDDFHMRQLRARQAESKAGFDSVQDGLRDNKNNLESLRRENKDLRMALHQTSKESTKSVTKVEAHILQSKIHSQRRIYDDLFAQNKEITLQIKKLEETQRGMMKENRIRAEQSPLAQKIRSLENRLDKSLVKHNEAVCIRRTYETILERLQEESLGFDNQLIAVDKTLKVKEHDDLELKGMSHDAEHAKEMARTEMDELKKTIESERHRKRKELEVRKTFVSSRLDHVQKQEKFLKFKKNQDEEAALASKLQSDENARRALVSTADEVQTEEEARRLHEYAEAYRKIKEYTRSANKHEVVMKWREVGETTESLRSEEKQVQARIDVLIAKRAGLRDKLNDIKYSGSAQMSSRRIVDEFTTHLSIAKVNLKKASDDCEDTKKLHALVRGGVEHLGQKLSLYRPEMSPPPIEKDNIERTVDVMKHCDEKLGMLIDELEGAGIQVRDPEEIKRMTMQLAAMDNVTLPDHNLRVHTVQLEVTEEKEERIRRLEDDGDEDLHSREDLKKMAVSAVECEMKKATKRKKN